jgi:integrase
MATIRKRNGKFEAQVRRTGQPHLSRSFIERKDALQWAHQMELAADRHDLPAVIDRRALSVTLGELVGRYRDTVTIRKRAAENERIALNAFALHPICRKSIAGLTTADFAAYRDERLKSIKPASLKRQLAPIRHLFEIAREEWGLPIRENPLAKLRLNGIDQRRERRLREGELDRLQEAAHACRNPLITPIIKLAVETGMRRGEILAIKRSHIDLEQQALLIPETKTGHSRTIPLTSKALGILQSIPGEGDRIFPLSANAFRLAWERVKCRAGIEDLHFHDLRHEAISRFFEAGLTTPEVALISGHRDMRMLFRYSHAMREHVLAKLNRTAVR